MPGITLKVGGERTKFTAEEAEQVKKRWEKELAEKDGVVTTVDLSCRAWSTEGLAVLKPVLDKVAPTVEVLDIQDTIASLMTDEGFEMMVQFTAIFKDSKEIVEINMNDNATGPRVLTLIAPLMGLPKIAKLHFSNCGLSLETMSQLNEALMIGGSGPGLARLETLVLDRNMIGVAGAQYVGEMLPSMLKLTYFSYCGCRPEKEGTKFLAEGLKNLVESNPDKVIEFAQLELADCDFGGEDDEFPVMEALGKALEKMPKMTHLSINDAGDMGEKGTGIVAQALQNAKCNLIELDMSAWCIGPDGSETLAELLRQNLDTLKVLTLETNELGNDGVEKILAAFKGDNCLEKLNLFENELDDGAIDLLLDANLPKLRLLSLKENMDLDEADDDKKAELRSKFPNATILISDDDEEEVEEKPDDDVDALAALMEKL